MKATFLILLLMPFCARSQKCHCPEKEIFCENGRPIKVFYFSNGKTIGLSGFFETKNKDTTYAGIAIYQCGENEPIQEWGEIEACKVTKNNDTLFVREISWLPLGNNFEEIAVPFFINKYYYDGNQLIHDTCFRTDLHKYTTKEIKEIFEKYNHLVKGNNDTVVGVGRMLLWAYISGNKKAEDYLKSFETIYGLFDGSFSGAYAEEWDITMRLYQNWNKINKK